MKTFINLFFAIAALSLFTFNNSNSQVTVSGALVGNGSYTTLSAAFTAINGGAQTSATIQIAITGNTTEPAAGAVLNNGAWTRLVIIPNGIRTISGAVNPGTPLIDFNGADKVEIFGVNSGGISLTISNTTVSSTSGTSTIRFQTDATNNKIDKCIILGSSNMAANVNGGNIWFGSNSSSTGNDNNVISNCDIGPAGSNLPSKGVYFSGTTTTTALNNSGDTILNCNIFNYFRDSTTSAGIYIGTGSTNTIMKGNQFYQTSARTQLTGNQHSGIWIANPTGDNFLISGNTIGFASSSGTGTYTFNGVAASRLIPVYFSSGTTTASYIESNYVSGISMSGPITGTGVNTSLTGIQVAAGLVNIGTLFGNTIGSITDTGSIRFTSSSASNTDICGIYLGGSGNYSLSYNAVGGITASNSGTGSCIIYLYRASTTSSNTVAFQNNLAGGYIANSINNKSSGVNTKTAGFYIDNPSATITGNTVQNLTSAGGTETNSQSSVSGITIVTGSANHVVSQNTIYNLKNTNGSSASVINGIFFNAANGTISRNFIHTLIISGNNSTASGIHVNGGTSTFQNNMVQLGIDTSGTGVNSGAAVNGINETGGNNNFYFNSVYVGGSPTSGTANTFAFSSTVTGVPRIFQNNIFYNARSNNGSTGKHYSVRVGGTVPNPSGLTINNNVYLANGSGGIFGLYNGSDVTNLSAWKSAVGQDANSFESDPKYINPAGTYLSTNLHINPSVPTVVEGTGFNIAAITDDYDGQTRSTLTPVDIGADAGNFIVGAIVNVAGAVSGNGIYTTLSDAFNAINLSAQTSSNIVITINGDVSESTSGAVLNAGTWSTLKIQPAGGASRSISANVNAGSTLIDLNGADNVTIDGLNTGGNSLTISNTSTSATSGTSTIRINNDGTNNKITNCSVLGSSTMEVGTNGGNILIGSTT
ncbi:MAG: hypothetical protein ABI840_10425, partial [bacterium]